MKKKKNINVHVTGASTDITRILSLHYEKWVETEAQNSVAICSGYHCLQHQV
jgi:hypothetical protein